MLSPRHAGGGGFAAFFVLVFQVSLHAQAPKTPARTRISGITLKDEKKVETDTASNTTSINLFSGLDALSDEHVTIFPPGAPFQQGTGHLFFAASTTALNPTGSGLVVLDGGTAPDATGTWRLHFAPEFDRSDPQGKIERGQIFLSAMSHHTCPGPSYGFDPTFDLNYAAPGTVLKDPTDQHPGAMLMVYDGTNQCAQMNNAEGKRPRYGTLGIATSRDFGIKWPTYLANSIEYHAPVLYNIILPGQNGIFGPNAPTGAFGSAVCEGDCYTSVKGLPDTYGRYAVLSQSVTIQAVHAATPPFTGNMGEGEPSAFLDTRPGGLPWLYIVHASVPGPLSLSVPTVRGGLSIARGVLAGGTQRLSFTNWYNHSFGLQTVKFPKFCDPFQEQCLTYTNAGLGSEGGGLTNPIFSVAGTFKNCLDTTSQTQSAGSISYVAATQEYLLIFICGGPHDPLTQRKGPGAAWFYSTMDATLYDLSNQDQWSPPLEIENSWGKFDECSYSTGWYPSFMSLNQQPGQLTTSGWAFSTAGCIDKVAGRTFTSHVFTISTK